MGQLQTTTMRDVTRRLDRHIGESTEIMKIMRTSAQAAQAARDAEKGIARIEFDLVRLDSKFQVVAGRVQVMAEPKTLELGEKGYLGRFCPPPSNINQKLYKMRLLRAG